MAKYELTEEQAKGIVQILSNITVKVSESQIVLGMIQALRKPVVEVIKKKEGDKNGTR